MRNYSKVDEICMGLDQALRSIFCKPQTTARLNPSAGASEAELSPEQRRHSAALMRINHAGEICAQALYHGQGLVSRNPEIRQQMQQAAIEEGDHLAWCKTRLLELGSHTSYLNPLWYAGSFVLGATAGIVGDRWSLGFVAETETQVVKHLEQQLKLLPASDEKSHKILQQMQKDELQHRDEAIKAGSAELPAFIKNLMGLTAKIMVKTAYWV